jgi:hypothetical protein
MKKVSLTRKAVGLCLATLFALSLIPTTSAASALTITTNDFVPFAQVAFVPCANGGAGEQVLISGTLHIEQHITINDNRATIKSHFQPQGAGGVGLTTGDNYNATGVTQEVDTLALTGGATEFTFVNNFKIIGQGADNNLLVHQLVHVTINANGDVTNTVDNTSAECQ